MSTYDGESTSALAGSISTQSFNYTYLQFLNDLNVKIQNKSGSIPVSVRTLINQVLRNEVASYDYSSLLRHSLTYQAVYDDIFRYPLHADMKQEALVDVLMYKNFDNPSSRRYRKVSPNVFRTMQEKDTIAFDYADGLQWMLGDFNTDDTNLLIHGMDSLTSNGTWSAGDDGENIAVNEFNYITGGSAISCDMASGGTEISIVNSTMTVIDLTGYNRFFVWVYFPTVTNLTSVSLYYGSDTSNYYTVLASQPFDTTSFKPGYNLVSFTTGTATGSPVITAIDYFKIKITYSSAPSITEEFVFDSLMAGIGDPIQHIYYSKFPWQSSAGVWKLDSTTNEDVINATDAEYRVWLASCAYEASTSIPLSKEMIQIRLNEYREAKATYAQMYPSRRIKERNYMYRPTINTNKRHTHFVKLDNINNAL
jgi:hypothetical protein